MLNFSTSAYLKLTWVHLDSVLFHGDLYNVISHILELITKKEGRPGRTPLCSPERPAAAHSPNPPHTTHKVTKSASLRHTAEQLREDRPLSPAFLLGWAHANSLQL